jgi:hypothetical protein
MASGQVECRSDHAYPGYPVAFYWQGERLEVTQVLSERRDPAGYTFRVSNERFGIFELNYNSNTDEWSVHQV